MKLVIVPKMADCSYTRQYGSHMDRSYIQKVLNEMDHDIDDKFDIMHESVFYSFQDNYDVVLFIGLNGSIKNYLKKPTKIKKVIWSNNQYDSFANPSLFENIDIIFNQNCKSLLKKDNQYYVPTGIQKREFEKCESKYDFIFIGSLFRYRKYNPTYRTDILKGLLDKGFTIVHYNGGYNKPHEKKIIDSELIKYENYTLKNEWAEPEQYNEGKYLLNMPFMCQTSKYKEDWGIDSKIIENIIWFHSWDIFRAIGAKANIITYDDCYEMRNLGLNDNNVHFYRNNPLNTLDIIEEISYIYNKGEQKCVSDQVIHKNSYDERWKFMIEKIKENYE